MSDTPKPGGPGVVAWELLLRTHAALVPTLSQELESATGLPLSWYDVLLELARTDENRLKMSELGQRVVLSRSHASRIVTEMAKAGLVDKSPDEHDKRTTWATLTPSGHSEFRKSASVYLEAIDKHFASHLSKSQADSMVRGLKVVLDETQ